MKFSNVLVRVCMTLGVAGIALADGPDFDPPLANVVIIRLAPHADIATFMAEFNLRVPGTTILDAIDSRDVYLLSLPVGVDENLVELMLDDDFASADPNSLDPNRPLLWGERCYLGQTAESRTGSVYVSFEIPDPDTTFGGQYATTSLGLTAAHAQSTGQGVTVAVIDTGIDATHPELTGRVLTSGFNFVEMSTDTRDRADGLDNDGDGKLDEAVGHGTFVAGLIALVAPDARLLPIVALDSDGNSDDFTITKAIYYAIDQNVEVINLSLGSTYKSDAVEDAIEEAKDGGIVVVGAVGNMNREDDAESPADISGTFGVVALDDANVKWSQSNYGGVVFISAPGASAHLVGDPNTFDPQRSILGPIPGGGYAWWEGTSLATAFVSGAAAVVRADLAICGSPEHVRNAVEQVLEESAVSIDAENPLISDDLGAGRLDIAAALAMLDAIVPGDLNADGVVALDDLATMLAVYGSFGSCGDLNSDGQVDLVDLAILLSNYGS